MSGLSWPRIVRLGLAQSALGALVGYSTFTLNRVMVVEAAAPAAIPAALVAWHYIVQLSRPHWGHASDRGRSRAPWIVGGMAALGLGAMAATDATLMWRSHPGAAVAVALLAYTLIGAGAGAAGTSVLAFLAARVAPERRPAAAAAAWTQMILGIVVCAGVTGRLLQPFSAQRLGEVSAGLAAVCLGLAAAAAWGQDAAGETGEAPAAGAASPGLRAALAEIRSDPVAARFTAFVFVSMLAFSVQELILEPFAALVFGLAPGQTALLSGVLHKGVLVGMILVGGLGARLGARRGAWMRGWTAGGCVGSAAAVAGLALAAARAGRWPLEANVFALGLANGVFAVSAISSMMGLAGAGRAAGAGTRMGVWGAAQAVAFAAGGLVGAVGVETLRGVGLPTHSAFMLVFAFEAGAFALASVTALRLGAATASPDGLIRAELREA